VRAVVTLHPSFGLRELAAIIRIPSRSHIRPNRVIAANRRFAHTAASPEDYHHKKPNRAALNEVFRLETERVIGNDWVVRYENQFLQVSRQGNHQAPAKGKVMVCEWQDGRLEIRYRGQKVLWEEIEERPQRAEVEQPRKAAIPYGGTPPTASHPWKQRYDGMQVRGMAKRPLRGPESFLAPPCATP
jgi:hypothetical protein